MFRMTNNQLMGGSRVVELLDVPSDGAGGDGAGGGSILTDDLGSQDGVGTDEGSGDAGDGDKGKSADVTHSWRDALSKEKRNHEAIKDMQKPDDLFDAYIKLRGGSENSVAIPGEDATDEDWKAFYEKLGTPDSIEGYSIEIGDDLPDAAKLYLDDEFIGAFKDGALDARLNQAQVEKFFGHISKAFTEKVLGLKEQLRTATEKQLKDEWKGNYKENVKKAQLAQKFILGEDFADYLEITGLGSDTRMVKGFLKAYNQIGEDRIVTGDLNSTKPAKEGLNFDWGEKKKT